MESSSLFITNFDGCLWTYPADEWRRVESQVATLSQFKSEVIALQRFFVSAAHECVLDSQGRILIPPTLRDYADLHREIVIVGMLRRFEIWSRPRWDSAFQEAEHRIGGVADRLAELGI